MRVLVINPPNRPFTESSLLIEPIDVLGIASFIQSLGYVVRMLDMDGKRMAPGDLHGSLIEFKPERIVIVFDYHIPLFTSECVLDVKALIQLIKGYDRIPVILAGKMAQHYPHLFGPSGVDVIIHYEAELALAELLGLPELEARSLKNISGISYFDSGNLCKNQARRELADLTALPIPDRSLVDLDDYIDVRTILSSRGCQLKCTFCPTPDFWGEWRARTAVQVVDELQLLVQNHAARKILFLDDNATVSARRMREIATELLARHLDVRLGCLGTAVCFDESTARLMYRAGFRWIHYGIESGSQRVLDRIKKGTTVAQMRAAILGTKSCGMRVRTSWIFDIPGSDVEDVDSSIDLILETEPDEVRAHYLSLRSGSELHQQYAQGDFPSQYIHHDLPSTSFSLPREVLLGKMDELSRRLESRGYFVVRDPAQWRDVESFRRKDPRLRFLSFCPMRYGMGWEL